MFQAVAVEASTLRVDTHTSSETRVKLKAVSGAATRGAPRPKPPSAERPGLHL
jgi:hypothetical protein